MVIQFQVGWSTNIQIRQLTRQYSHSQSLRDGKAVFLTEFQHSCGVRHTHERMNPKLQNMLNEKAWMRVCACVSTVRRGRKTKIRIRWSVWVCDSRPKLRSFLGGSQITWCCQESYLTVCPTSPARDSIRCWGTLSIQILPRTLRRCFARPPSFPPLHLRPPM